MDELWRWKRTTAGDRVVLTSPHDDAQVHVYRRAWRPLREFAGGSIERITIGRGEHAALIRSRVGWRFELTGIVVRDDHLAIVEGVTLSNDIEDIVRDLLECICSAGDRLRVRMYSYRPPAGWFGVRRALATCWLAPAYPRDAARLVVCDALPEDSAVIATRDLLWPVSSNSEIEDLTIGDFRYRIQLHDGTPSHAATLRELVGSIEPIPSCATETISAHVLDWLVW